MAIGPNCIQGCVGMHTTRFTSGVCAVCAAFLLAAGPIAAFCDDQPTTIAQDNEQKAQIHYVNGETANKAGDVLTAVVEWEAALTLKPSSALSAKCLVAAAAKLGDEGRNAYAHYVNAVDLERQNKLDEAAEEVSLAQTYKPSGSVPSCLTVKAAEITDLKKLAAKALQDSILAATSAEKSTATTTAAATKAADDSATKAVATSTSTSSTSKQSKKQKSSKQSTHRSTPKASRQTVRAVRLSHPKLVYQHGYTINGVHIPGHYKFKTVR